MYAIMCEVMQPRQNSMFTTPVGARYMQQEVWVELPAAIRHAQALASHSTHIKFSIMDLDLDTEFYYPPQEKKYAAVFD